MLSAWNAIIRNRHLALVSAGTSTQTHDKTQFLATKTATFGRIMPSDVIVGQVMD